MTENEYRVMQMSEYSLYPSILKLSISIKSILVVKSYLHNRQSTEVLEERNVEKGKLDITSGVMRALCLRSL